MMVLYARKKNDQWVQLGYVLGMVGVGKRGGHGCTVRGH